MPPHFTINAAFGRVVEVGENRHDGEYFSSVGGSTKYISAITGTTFTMMPGANDRTLVSVPFAQPGYAPLETGIVCWSLAAAAETDITSGTSGASGASGASGTSGTELARPEPGIRPILATDETMRAFVDPVAMNWLGQDRHLAAVSAGGTDVLTMNADDLHAWWMYTYRRNEVNGWLEQARANIVAPNIFMFVGHETPPLVTRASLWAPGVATIFPDGAIDVVVVTLPQDEGLRIVEWAGLSDVLAPYLQRVEAAFDDGSVDLLALTVEASAQAFAAFDDSQLETLAGPASRAQPGSVFGSR